MPNIAVYGTLNEISAKLCRMKEVIANRVAVGYEPKQHDEEWQYHTIQDIKVCPDCVPLNGTLYRGDYIVSDFPYYVTVNALEVRVRNVTNFHAAERCRCTAKWVNTHEVLVERLADEMENA